MGMYVYMFFVLGGFFCSQLSTWLGAMKRGRSASSTITFRMAYNKYFSLTAGLYLMLVSGTVYMFGAFADDLRMTVGYTQTQVNFISTVMNAGAWAGVFTGMFYDRFGPRPSSILGVRLVS